MTAYVEYPGTFVVPGIGEDLKFLQNGRYFLYGIYLLYPGKQKQLLDERGDFLFQMEGRLLGQGAYKQDRKAF